MIAQEVFDHLTARRHMGRVRKAERRALNKLRRLITRRYDPLVEHRIGSTSIVLPLSHELPHYQQLYPDYCQNLIRLASLLDRAWPDLTIIDVGANVGDSLAFLRTATAAPVLCIDGDRMYAPVLRRNVERFDEVEVDECYVLGDLPTGDTDGRVARSGGTATAIPGADGVDGVSVRSLESILADHPRFAAAGLVKVDTDGFDAAILRSAKRFLEERHPVLFFELDPFFIDQVRDVRGRNVLEDLAAMGYGHAIVWENTGEFLMTLELDDVRRRQELIARYTGLGGMRYCDVAVFAREHRALFDEMRCLELKRLDEGTRRRAATRRGPD